MSIPPLPTGVPALPQHALCATLDFESYSEAGYRWDEAKNTWLGPEGSNAKGLGAVGSRKYAEHPSTEVLTLSYSLPGAHKGRWSKGQLGATVVNRHHGGGYDVYIGRGTKWGNPYSDKPGDGVKRVVASRAEAVEAYRQYVLRTPELMAAIPELIGKRIGCSCAPQQCHGDVLAELAGLPWALFNHIARGGLIEAHNAMFERNLWTFCCQPKYGFPPVEPKQWRCSMSKARAAGYPGALAQLGAAMRLNIQKDKRGTDLIKLLCMPRKPTKADPRLRILPSEDPEAFEDLQSYCDTDRDTEHEASSKLPDLIPSELAYWQADQAVNFRGLGVDLPHVEAACEIVNQTLAQFGAECERLTGGIGPSKVQALAGWCTAMGVRMDSLDAESLETALKRTDLPPVVRRVLEIRQLAGSASVKKVFAMRSFCSDAGRLHDLFIYHGARTGRDTHADVQPGNLPKAGPKLWHCLAPLCNRWYGSHLTVCPWCSSTQREGLGAAEGKPGHKEKPEAWGIHGVEDALEAIASRSASAVQYAFGDALLAVSGVVRSLVCAGPGNELICSDYSSIEAVVLAVIAGEQWRIDAFQRGEDIYLRGASAITGVPYDEYKAYPGKHPDRQSIGKVSELAFGYGGGLNSWRAFGGQGSDAEAKGYVQRWRDASPMVVELWGGQYRGKPWNPDKQEYFGLEGMAVQAILQPRQTFHYRMLSFRMDPDADVLEMFLPSGRSLKYREPRLTYSAAREGWAPTYQISFMTWNSNPKMGPLGWVRLGTYSGRLAENADQAIARDIMAHAVVNLEQRNYPVVLRIHDELASEVPVGFGSVEEYEDIMCDLPHWADGWPIRASDGWRGRRYRKG